MQKLKIAVNSLGIYGYTHCKYRKIGDFYNPVKVCRRWAKTRTGCVVVFNPTNHLKENSA